MYKINCLNPISAVGMDLFTDEYTLTPGFGHCGCGAGTQCFHA